MKSSTLIIGIAMVLTSCGKYSDVHVDSELEPYALEFELDIGVNTSGISIRFGELIGNQIGLCTIRGSENKEITIKREYWDKLSKLARQELMYHELGHCAMDLDHDDATVFDPNTRLNIAASIMHPYFFGNSYNWSSYNSAYKKALRARSRISF